MVTFSKAIYYNGISFAARYTFATKERDEESGLSYFGVRYYSSDLSIWLSVDPMSDKYPSLSPYVYCANNPVKLVDPDGQEIGNFYSDSPGCIREQQAVFYNSKSQEILLMDLKSVYKIINYKQ